MKKLVFLATAVMVLGLIGAGCGAATPEVVTVEKIVEKPVIQTVVVTEEKIVEKTKVETVVVEKEKPVEVEKVVTKVVEKEVEKEVVVTATPVKVAKPVTLNFNLGTEPPTADPGLATDTTSVFVDKQLFMGLTAFDAKTAAVIPDLATSWEVSDDGLTWTFHMRDDVPWVFYNPATGEVEEQRIVDAHDVEYGVKRTINPDTASDYAYVLYIIKNAQPVNEGEEGVTLDDVGVTAVDDFTVEFTLETPAGYFPAIAGMWVARPVPQEVIEDKGDRWTEPGFIWTNGPYVMTEWVHGASMRMERNPLWPDWGQADAGNVEVLDFVMITEASTSFALYENNELDTAGVPLPEMDRVKADPVLSKELLIAPRLCTYYYGFTNTKPPFDNVHVRKAFSMAIDRQTLIDTVLKGGQIPATSFAPPGIFGAPPPGEVGLGFDPEAAKAELAEAGYPNGEGFPEVTLMHNTSEGHARIAAAIQSMWKEILNVDVKVENQEWKVYLQTLKKTTPIEDMPHIWRLGWCADYPDENNWVYEVFNSDAGANRLRRNCLDPNCTETTTSKFDELTKQAQVESDPAKRTELYREAERILSEEEAAVAFIYHYTQVNVTKPWLDRTFAALGGQPVWMWSIDWAAKAAATGQ